MRKNLLIASALIAMCMATGLQAATIDVGSSDFTYGHNNGSGVAFNRDDYYYATSDPNPLYVSGGRYYVPGWSHRYLVYEFKADQGATIEDVSMSATSYLANNSTLKILWATEFSTDWTTWTTALNAPGVWAGSYSTPTINFSPNSDTLYVAYYGYNGGADAWNWQLQSDNIAMTVVPEPATLSLLFAGGVAALIRRRKKA